MAKAIINEKEGTNKSTTVTTLGYLLAKAEKKTLAINFDGQGNASTICGIANPNQVKMTIATLLGQVILEKPLPDHAEYIHHNENGVDLISANSKLFNHRNTL